MFNLFSKLFKSSQNNVSQLIQKLDKTSIVSCVLGLNKANNIGNLTNRILHSTLLLIDTNSHKIDENGYGILIEYGDFSPEMSVEEGRRVKDGSVIYRYGEKGGLRYYSLNYSKFLKDFANFAFVCMDIEKEKRMTFWYFINKCAPLQENLWTQNNYNIFKNNSQNFIAEALKVLKPYFNSRMITINNLMFKHDKKKINYIPQPIIDALNAIKNKSDNLDKIINKNNDENKDINKDVNIDNNKDENKDNNKEEDYRNKYEILNLIAKGGYGEVYKAKIKKTGELRAIKLISKVNIKQNLRNEYNTNDIEGAFNEFQNRLLDEIKYMEICSKNNTNSNSIKYYDYYNTNENLVIVMELCDTNLQLLLNERQEGFVVGEILDILNQLNNTFKIMKDNKIIHRDLKLANILVKYEDNDKKNLL